MRELLRVLLCVMKCMRTHNTAVDRLNMFYVTVPDKIYTFIAETGRVGPGVPLKPLITPNYGEEETSAGQETIRDLWSLNNMFSVEDENMNCVLCTTFLSLLPKDEVKGFQQTGNFVKASRHCSRRPKKVWCSWCSQMNQWINKRWWNPSSPR